MKTSMRLVRVWGWALSGALALGQPAMAGQSPASPKRPPVSAAAVKEAAKAEAGKTDAAKAEAGKTETKKAETAKAGPARSDSSFTLKGGTEGTDFRTLTIEGEDRVHVDFDRPPIDVTLDPGKVPGLELGSAQDVLDRTMPDLVDPFTDLSKADRSPYLARPWLNEFASGAVARFQPAVKDVDRWKLLVANSRGETVATYQGRGDPPKEIAWDGRAQSGTPVVPGLTYSYAFEAYDKAGNKRNFVGQGFTVSAYRIDGPDGPTLLFSARDLTEGKNAPIVLEAASAWNQVNRSRDPIRILASARTRDEANGLAARVAAVFAANTLGDPARIQTAVDVRPDAPEGGVVQIGPVRGVQLPDRQPAGDGKTKGRHKGR